MAAATVAHNAAITSLETSQKVLLVQEEDLLMEALAAIAAVSAVSKLSDFLASRDHDHETGGGWTAPTATESAPSGQGPPRASSAQGQRWPTAKSSVGIAPSLLYFAACTLEFRCHLHLRRGAPFWSIAAADLKDISRLVGPLVARGARGLGATSTLPPPAAATHASGSTPAASGPMDLATLISTIHGAAKTAGAAAGASTQTTGTGGDKGRGKHQRGVLTQLSFWGTTVGSIDSAPNATSTGHRRVFASPGGGVVGGVKQVFVRAWAILGLLDLAHFGDHHTAVESFGCVSASG